MSKELNQLSKTVSYYLRHKPEELDLTLDKDGWVKIETFIEKLQNKKVNIDLKTLELIAASDNKGRYTIKDGFIRANQGHSSTQVNLEFKKETPPLELFHGTSLSNYELIKASGGLKPMSRHYVHLSPDLSTAQIVANRSKEKTIILKIKAQDMMNDGYSFNLSDNGVWLIEDVPLKYIQE